MSGSIINFQPPKLPAGYLHIAHNTSLWGHILVAQDRQEPTHYKCLFNSMEHQFEFNLEAAPCCSPADVVTHFSTVCKTSAVAVAEQEALDVLMN